jgi:heptaprenyl diphosphate synthase
MKISTRSLALCAVLTALALGLSYLENLFPVSLVIPLPGVKLGLANIVTVFALYELGAWPALGILLARCLLGGVFAGNASALLFSLMGGFLAMLVMILLKRARKLSIYGVSVGGAAAHNVGQIGAAILTLGNTAVIGYLPFLLAVSLATGALTGFVAALLFRSMKNVHLAHE